MHDTKPEGKLFDCNNNVHSRDQECLRRANPCSCRCRKGANRELWRFARTFCQCWWKPQTGCLSLRQTVRRISDKFSLCLPFRLEIWFSVSAGVNQSINDVFDLTHSCVERLILSCFLEQSLYLVMALVTSDDSTRLMPWVFFRLLFFFTLYIFQLS